MKNLNEAQRMNAIALESENTSLMNVKHSMAYISLCDRIHDAALRGEFQLTEKMGYYGKVEQDNCNDILKALKNDGFIVNSTLCLNNSSLDLIEKVISISWA